MKDADTTVIEESETEEKLANVFPRLDLEGYGYRILAFDKSIEKAQNARVAEIMVFYQENP